MTDKHIPASKLLALQKYGFYGMAGALDSITPVIKADALRALIDEAPEVEPMAKVLCIIDEDGELEPHTFYSNDEAPRQEELKNKFVIFDVWLSPPPIPDLTKSIKEAESEGYIVDPLSALRDTVNGILENGEILPPKTRRAVYTIKHILGELLTVDPVAEVTKNGIYGIDRNTVFLVGSKLYTSPPPSTDLIKLVGELVESLEVAFELTRHDFEMAKYSSQWAAILTRAKEYLK